MGGVVGGRRSNLANAYSDSPPDPVAGELDLQVRQVLPGGLGFGCGLLVLLFLLVSSWWKLPARSSWACRPAELCCTLSELQL